MRYEEIKNILDRYWEGEASLEEERTLRQYFNEGNIDERLLAELPFFQALAQEKAIQMSPNKVAAPMRPQRYQWAAAASIALIIAVGWWMWPTGDVQELVADTPALIQQPSNLTQPAVQKSVPEINPAPTKPIAQITPKPPKKRVKKPQKAAEPAIDAETAQAMAEIKAALALVSAKLDKGKNQAIKGASYLESIDKVPKRKEG